MIRKTERALVQGSHKEGSGPERVPTSKTLQKQTEIITQLPFSKPARQLALLDGGFTQPAPGLLKSRHCAHVARQPNVCRISTTHGNAS